MQKSLSSLLAPLPLAALLLAGCSDSGEAQQQTAQPPGGENTAPATEQAASGGDSGDMEDAYAMFNTDATIRDIMNSMIDPNADAVWNSVRYEITEEGEQQYQPETEEDWAGLRARVITMIEGANALMIPGRDVAPPGASTPYPDYEYTPDEVEQRLQEDRETWVAYLQSFQQVTARTLEAIEAQDVDALVSNSGAIDQACEACHSQYWYRPEPLNQDQ